MRLLASSRVSLPGVLGKPILVDVLPAAEATALFRDLWAGIDPLPADAGLQPFVVGQLGGHALAVTLAARLGDCYSYPQLVQRWAAAGAESAQDPQDQSRLGSLPVSLRLTADALARHEGALALWTVVALFATGVPDAVLVQLESLGGWPQARPWLVRHHVLTRRDERWYMLPPLARYALDASLAQGAGFDWAACRHVPQTLIGNAVKQADSIASTAEALVARGWLLDQFSTLARLLLRDLAFDAPRLLVGALTAEASPELTVREREVLRWTMEGKSNWSIGQLMKLSENTVSFHIRNAMSKLQCSSKHMAVARALRLGLI